MGGERNGHQSQLLTQDANHLFSEESCGTLFSINSAGQGLLGWHCNNRSPVALIFHTKVEKIVTELQTQPVSQKR